MGGEARREHSHLQLLLMPVLMFLTPLASSGILVQTFDSNNTVTHYEKNQLKGLTVLYLGDLPYVNNYPFHDNVRWDTWRRFTEISAAYQPWIWTGGSHEIDFAPEIYSSSHVHAYERSELISNIAYNITNALCTPAKDKSAPVYITVGDGGNIGLVTRYT
ncbi:hypothetical protein Ancab_027390 [Ancistrocladus abbreviatus]